MDVVTCSGTVTWAAPLARADVCAVKGRAALGSLALDSLALLALQVLALRHSWLNPLL